MNDTPESLLKELAQADPVYHDADSGVMSCTLCKTRSVKGGHRDDCLWLRARKLIAWCEEQAKLIAAADPPPTQGARF
jgi:hypothetical protein